MCLIAFSYKEDPIYKLILLANRDEFFDRPTREAQFDGNLLAGKDLLGCGSWLGISRNGRLAAVTNFRNSCERKVSPISRGLLVTGFLNSNSSVSAYIKSISLQRDHYEPFNLLLFDGEDFVCYSSTQNQSSKIMLGIHALSNHHVDSNWPKINKIKQSLHQLLSKKCAHSPESYLKLMEDSTPADDNLLPKTGVGLEWERKLSPIFINDTEYGTRSTALLLIDYSNKAIFVEKSHYPDKKSVITCKEAFVLEQ
jgi:uncharacterized protein with NRDE domain